MVTNSIVYPITHVRSIQIFTLLYILFFSWLAYARGSYEFFFYTTYMIGMVWVISHYYSKLHISELVVAMISLFGLLHVMGDSLYLDGVRLYDIGFFNGLFHFDNIVHMCGGMLATAIAFNVLHHHFDISVQKHPLIESYILITVACGIGAYNELVELFLVVFLNAGVAVGDYLNNAFDLVFNLFGAFIGTALIFYIYPDRRTHTHRT